MKGYANKILRVDLSKKQVWEEVLENRLIEKYLGGSGLGAKYLFDMTTRETKPLSPDNPLILMGGPFADTKTPMSGRTEIVSKSPLTGGWGESDMGGFWGVALRKAGYDGIIVTGKSNGPVWLHVTAAGCSIKAADEIWGKNTFETSEIVKSISGNQAKVLSIGTAGEKMVRMSGIVSEDKHARIAARCGLGAVMGSKKLKAIAVSGNLENKIADSQRLIASVRSVSRQIRERALRRSEYGTAGSIVSAEAIGDLPLRNWLWGKWEEGAKKIGGEVLTRDYLTNKYRCPNCSVGCGRVVKLKSGPYAGEEVGGPEYETLGSLGTMCLIEDMDAIVEANDLCNRYGIDTISVGGAIAFAMECYEHGLISTLDTDGLPLNWGDSKVLLELVKQIGEAEGLGKLLGQGVKAAAKIIGKNSHKYAIEARGMELPMHDPRSAASAALAYATSPRGACHWAMSHAAEYSLAMPDLGWEKPLDRFASQGKAGMTAKMQDFVSVINALCICRFLVHSGINSQHIAEWYSAVTGHDLKAQELIKAGERIFNLKRLYNIRCNLGGEADYIHERVLKVKRGLGGASEHLPRLDLMLPDYYKYRGWDEHGVPTKTKLKELGLEEEGGAVFESTYNP